MSELQATIKSDKKLLAFLEAAPDAIVVVDHDGYIVMINRLTENIFAYKREELIGQKVEILIPEPARKNHVNHRSYYSNEPHTRPMGEGRELRGRRKDGSEFPIEISLSPLVSESENLIISIIRDITDRRRAEEQIKSALREKEVLLKEIHHRVKNNLQVTSSLLRLQSEFIQDQQARLFFSESQNRIRSMALVHEKLYKSNDLSRINFFEYADSLIQLLFRSFGVDNRFIKYSLEGSPVFMSIEHAVPCGLIINELLSNCLKHAFPNKREGKVSITIDSVSNNTHIVISDNGIGLPEDFEFQRSDTLGLQLVRTLVKQLAAEINIHSDNGTKYHILLQGTI